MPSEAAAFEAAAFDHVAVALVDRTPFWDVFAGDLGGRWAGGDDTLGGFSFGQLRYANGMKVEALEPLSPGSDFLTRFLARSGPGPHHLTFKVDDLAATVGRAAAAGYEPLGVSLDDPQWQEAFIHPTAAGIVVQLAWSPPDLNGGDLNGGALNDGALNDGALNDPRPAWLPEPRVAGTAELVHVAHAVADLEGALALFKGLLGGRSVDAGAQAGVGFVDLAYPGPGRLRLVGGAPLGPWEHGRAGRLHSICFRLTDPGRVGGAVARDGWWEVVAAPPIGVRLVLIEPEAPVPLAV